MTDEETDIRRLCDRFDFPFGGCREAEDGDHLILEPSSLSELPEAERLSELGDELRSLGYRHVSFAVEDPS
ncbi:MAG: hypothetical protein ABEL76_12550 [Bradymonadaceae bacterium]